MAASERAHASVASGTRRKATWHIVQSSEAAARSESEEFAASVERDLEQLPTIEEREQNR